MIYTITLNPAIDRLIFLTEELTKRKTNRASRVLYDIGGKGTHGSYAMSKLGVDNLALGFAGKENKNKFYQVLEDKKINHHFFLVDRSETRESIVMIDPNNKGSTMVTEPSLTISRNKKEDLLNYLQKNLTAEDFVLIAGSLPNQFTIDDLAELMETVKKANSFLACDLSGEALKVAISKKVDFIKPNEFELKELLKEGETVDQKIIELSAKVRCYHPDQKQCDPLYQGQHCLAYKQLSPVALTMPIYPEYDQGYKHVCLTNLKSKRILLTFQRS